MKKYSVSFGAFIRGYAQTDFEAESDEAAKIKAIDIFKANNGMDGLDWGEFDYCNLAQPSIVSLQEVKTEPGKMADIFRDVMEGYDFATTPEDARDYAGAAMLEMLKRIALFMGVMKRSGDLKHPNDERLLFEIKTLILQAEAYQ